MKHAVPRRKLSCVNYGTYSNPVKLSKLFETTLGRSRTFDYSFRAKYVKNVECANVRELALMHRTLH